MKTRSWEGLFPAVATLMRPDHKLDLAATAVHLERLLAAGAQGLVVLGTTGENNSLEPDEKQRVIEHAAAVVRGRVPVIAGVSEFTTAAACTLAADAELLGADGLMVLPAMVYRADARETLTHFRAVAAATGLPILIYNNPGTYGVDVSPAMFEALAREWNIVAIKESSGDATRITDIVSRLGDRYRLFCGADGVVLESLLLGAKGWISGFHNVFPRESRWLLDLALAGRYAEARAVLRWFMPLFHLDVSPKLVQYVKLGMAELGYGPETVRAPRLAVAGQERVKVLALVRQLAASRPRMARRRTLCNVSKS